RPLVATSLWMMLTNLVAPLLMNMDRLFISNGEGPAMLASYAPAMDFTQKLFTLFGVVMVVVFPAIGAHLAENPAGARAFYRQAATFLLFWSPPAVLAAGAVSLPAMRLWLGESHGPEAGRIFAVLLVGCLAGLPGGISFGAVQASGGAKAASLFHLSEAIVFAGLFWLGLHHGSLMVVAWIWSGRHVVDSIGMHLLAFRRGAGSHPAAGAAWGYPAGIFLMACVALLHSFHPWAGIATGIVASGAWTGALLSSARGRETIPWSVRSRISGLLGRNMA
ncbi:MAG TPA: oligosaccharide flippase family protein, partial [Fibrobacteria bacterium]|nr:oligosaccharide flippase family protein [Fibrobacteria bacterium]